MRFLIKIIYQGLLDARQVKNDLLIENLNFSFRISITIVSKKIFAFSISFYFLLFNQNMPISKNI